MGRIAPEKQAARGFAVQALQDGNWDLVATPSQGWTRDGGEECFRSGDFTSPWHHQRGEINSPLQRCKNGVATCFEIEFVSNRFYRLDECVEVSIVKGVPRALEAGSSATQCSPRLRWSDQSSAGQPV